MTDKPLLTAIYGVLFVLLIIGMVVRLIRGDPEE